MQTKCANLEHILLKNDLLTKKKIDYLLQLFFLFLSKWLIRILRFSASVEHLLNDCSLILLKSFR